MPPVSEAQRRAMAAAAAGHSDLGIPMHVGQEYMSADPGGSMPPRQMPKMGKQADMDARRAAFMAKLKKLHR